MEGLEERKDESEVMLQASVSKLLNGKLSLQSDIEVIHRIGKQTKDKPRPVIMKLKTFEERQDCLKATPRLKGTNY